MTNIDGIDASMGLTVELRTAIERAAADAGVALVGLADLSSLEGLPVGDPSTLGFRSAVSLAVEMPEDAVRSAKGSPSISLRESYKQNNKCLKQASASIAALLQEAGFQARMVDPAQRVVPEELLGPISHKAVALRAGLGWIGKNGLLITERFGPRVRLGTVLTDMPVAGPGEMPVNQCGDCTACIDHCPTRSLKRSSFPEHPSSRDEVMDWAKCGRYEAALIGDGSKPEKACGRCIVNCPHSFPGR